VTITVNKLLISKGSFHSYFFNSRGRNEKFTTRDWPGFKRTGEASLSKVRSFTKSGS
jgi:hypothetical protein